MAMAKTWALSNFLSFSSSSSSSPPMDSWLWLIWKVLVLSTTLLALVSSSAEQTLLHPVVLVPGDFGNQLNAKLTSAYTSSNFLCRRAFWSRNFFRLWLNALTLVPPLTSCFAERMMLSCNPSTSRCENTLGVETVVPFFGSTEGMAYLDPSFKKLSVYMGVLVEALEAHGYVDGKSLVGAPYDFRYAPGGIHESPVATNYLEKLKSLIETTYYDNGNQEVILLSHSLGGLWVRYFLAQQPPEWCQKHVKRFIAVSAPWGGSVETMRTFASGTTEGAPLLDPLVLRGEQRSLESNLWLLPVPSLFGNSTLVMTLIKNYTAEDIPEFLTDIGYPEGVPMYLSRVPPLVQEWEAPSIPVTLVFSRGVATAEMLVYGEKGFDRQPDFVNGEGDGTVNLHSLLAVVEKWKANLKVVEIQGKSHTTILTDASSVATIVDEIMKESAEEEGGISSS